jgi:hypothetical protein
MSKPHGQLGFTPITGKEVASMVDFIAKAQAVLGDAVVLSTKARQGQAKLRRGAQQVIPTLAALALKHGFEMQSMPISAMSAKLEHAQLLREVLGAVTVLQKKLEDAILVSEGESWQTATVTYSTLRRAAKSRPEIGVEIAAVEHWFRSAYRGAKSTAPSAPTPTEAPASTTPAVAPAAKSNGAGAAAPVTTA